MEIFLPESFLNRMKYLLNDEYSDFIAEYEKEPFKGFRLNTLKCSFEKLKSLLDVEFTQSPFSPLSFYIKSNEKLGNNPLHHCGAFYLQEPSASSAVTVLDIKPYEKVLDLCSAPGGKSTQIATLLNNTGVIWSNEIVKNRANILLSNVERMGIKNCIISSLSPDKLCNSLRGYFDKILVDAPCSGEGMFRKDIKAVSEWSEEHTKSCMERQLQILNSAKLALKNNGVIVYSTCTFSIFENEKVIQRFLSENKDFSLCDCSNFNFGRGGFNMPQTKRIYPMDGGEGHFIAKLVKNSESYGYTPDDNLKSNTNSKQNKDIINQTQKLYTEIFNNKNYPEFTIINDKIIIKPKISPYFKSNGILRCGVLFGEIKKNRIEPAHHIFTSGNIYDFNNVLDLDINSNKLNPFLLGEEIDVNSSLKGYTAVCVNGITLGFGKASNGKLKNKYPKGLRKVK